MITKVFNLGKKPYMYEINEDTHAVLLGKSEWNEESFCKLSLMFVIVTSNEQIADEQITIEELGQRSDIIGEYINRSSKFNSGNFTDFDAQRYIKSRYRDIIRHLNRQRNGEDRIRILQEYSREFIRCNCQNDNMITSEETGIAQISSVSNFYNI